MKTISEHTTELLALKTALAGAQQELNRAYGRFDQAVEPELVEACCYEISAGKARCSYLLRRIKLLSGEEEGPWPSAR